MDIIIIYQHDCLYYAFCYTVGSGANVTNGVTAMLITAPGGELLDIRVEWSIKSEYLGYQFTTIRVELNPGQVGRDICVHDSTVDFNDEQLDCNTQYTPKVRAVIQKDPRGKL